MEQIKPGKYVEMVYDLYVENPDGEQLVHQVDPENPERIVFGVTRGVIAPLEKALDGLAAGGKFDVKVNEIDGKFDAEHIKPGADIPMMTADGFRLNGKVLEVTDDKVKMDFNHPLAGKDVRFKGKVVTVRDATPEELQPAHGCGCGCDHDHCGDGNCSDHSCGDGCGCH